MHHSLSLFDLNYSTMKRAMCRVIQLAHSLPEFFQQSLSLARCRRFGFRLSTTVATLLNLEHIDLALHGFINQTAH